MLAAMADVLFVIDPLEALNPAADSTVVMITEALRRDHQVFGVTLGDLTLDGSHAFANARQITGGPEALSWGEPSRRAMAKFAAVFMRKDPPFDESYLIATWILDRAGTLVVNDPAGLRSLNEKLVISRPVFDGLIPPTRLLRSEDDLRQALADFGGTMIVKPVFGFGGREILQARDGDPNLGSILEIATHEGARWTVAQGFIKEAIQGDKRILMIEGDPIGAVLRVPARGELRNNFHAGGRPEPTELTDRDLEICAACGPVLREHGQLFAGIDVIGGYLTEINVTSPTGMQEVNRLDGLQGDSTTQARFWDAVEARWAAA